MSTTPDENALPALFDHCKRTYAAMLEEAHAVTVQTSSPSSSNAEDKSVDPDEGTTELKIIVYEGFLTQLVTGTLNLSVPYYTSVRQHLIRMGCIRQLKRGGGSAPSQWEMIYEPTEEAFLKALPPKTPKQTKEAALEQQIVGLSQRIAELESWQQSVNEMLVSKFGTEAVEV